MAAPSSDEYLSYDEVYRLLRNEFCSDGSDWAGIPMPVQGFSMTIHPSYPFAKLLENEFPDHTNPAIDDEPPADGSDEPELKNAWYSYRLGHFVGILRKGSKYYSRPLYLHNPVKRIVETMMASQTWDLPSEFRAMRKLRRHVDAWQFHTYVLTGTFIEVSRKSGVIYVFRRLRPTIALRAEGHVLAILCSHPIGFYDDTWAGAMVPTDDLIAHLLLMRADEHYFWRICNQHPVRELGGLA